MLDDLAGKRTGERIQVLRERRGLSRPVLAGLVGMSASWADRVFMAFYMITKTFQWRAD